MFANINAIGLFELMGIVMGIENCEQQVMKHDYPRHGNFFELQLNCLDIAHLWILRIFRWFYTKNAAGTSRSQPISWGL